MPRCSAPSRAASSTPEYVRQVLHRLGDRAGIEKRVHPHGLRHTHAAELEMAERAGHRDQQGASVTHQLP